jgi:hypothetical protein
MHMCDTSITPYAAYHPDCLRKHFVRRHEVRLAVVLKKYSTHDVCAVQTVCAVQSYAHVRHK